MSSPELDIELSPEAREDRITIIQHTTLKWGEAQARTYHAAIEEAFGTIRRHPAIGYTSSELPSYYRLFLVGSHVITYYREGDVIYVARILHQRMNLRRNLPV